MNEGIQETLLNGVLGILAISSDPTSCAEHFLGMAFVEFIKGGFVAALGDCHEPFITHLLVFARPTVPPIRTQ